MTKWESITNVREIDKKVVDGHFHAEKVRNKHFKALVLEKL